jgi:hypothetical protein
VISAGATSNEPSSVSIWNGRTNRYSRRCNQNWMLKRIGPRGGSNTLRQLVGSTWRIVLSRTADESAAIGSPAPEVGVLVASMREVNLDLGWRVESRDRQIASRRLPGLSFSNGQSSHCYGSADETFVRVWDAERFCHLLTPRRHRQPRGGVALRQRAKSSPVELLEA